MASRNPLLQLLHNRRSAQSFDPTKSITEETLTLIKQASLRAPSGLNTQPYKCVLIKSEELKKELSHVMLGPRNTQRVLTAPVIAVFLADCQVWKRPMIERDENRTNAEIERMKRNVELVSGSHGAAFRMGLIQASSLAPTMIPNDPTVWGVKQTMLFVDHYLLACTALGLGTAPMEGFDEIRVRKIVKASDRYYCPIVVPTGYEPPANTVNRVFSKRLSPEYIFADDSLDEIKKEED